MRKIFLQCIMLFIFFTLIVPSAYAQGGVVLVLSGGGARGLAHIGILKVFEEHGIKIEGIVGTSIGSLVGGLYSCGYSAAELENMLAGLDLTSLLYGRQREADAPPGEQEDTSANSLFRLEMDEGGHITGPLGGLGGKRLLEKLQEWTSVCPVLDFAELHFPFAAVATDIVTGEAVVLNKGNLASAMRASMAIPGLFSPWTVDGRLLVDGGLVSNAPVLVARDLFPGYPVIAVDVSGKGKERENIRTVVDVLDQMITIMTMRNVQEDLKYADLVLTPEVGGLPMLDLAGHEDIIRSGESVATEFLEQIIAVASLPSPPSRVEKAGPMIVADIRVVGLGEKMSEDLRRRYTRWINREADPAAIIQACVELRQRDNVRTADYFMEYLPDGRTVVVLNIEKEPVWEISGGGYAANLDPYSSVYLDVVRRDLFSEGDSLKSLFGISENWQFSSRYLAPVEEGGRRWEINVKAGERIRASPGGPGIEWEQYNAGVWRHFGVGSFRASLGYAGELISFEGQTHSFSGPTLTLAWEGLDDSIDPSEGFSASLSLWWKNTNSLLATMRFLGVVALEGDWRLYARGGAILGDGPSVYHAAWLGARGELYTMAVNPIQAEKAVWIGMGLRKVFLKSWWGTINLDLFATSGQTFDQSWKSGEKVWETGLALSLPGKFFDGKILVLYDDRSEWSFGFTIGRPLWENDPLP